MNMTLLIRKILNNKFLVQVLLIFLLLLEFIHMLELLCINIQSRLNIVENLLVLIIVCSMMLQIWILLFNVFYVLMIIISLQNNVIRDRKIIQIVLKDLLIKMSVKFLESVQTRQLFTRLLMFM